MLLGCPNVPSNHSHYQLLVEQQTNLVEFETQNLHHLRRSLKVVEALSSQNLHKSLAMYGLPHKSEFPLYESSWNVSNCCPCGIGPQRWLWDSLKYARKVSSTGWLDHWESFLRGDYGRDPMTQEQSSSLKMRGWDQWERCWKDWANEDLLDFQCYLELISSSNLLPERSTELRRSIWGLRILQLNTFAKNCHNHNGRVHMSRPKKCVGNMFAHLHPHTSCNSSSLNS